MQFRKTLGAREKLALGVVRSLRTTPQQAPSANHSVFCLSLSAPHFDTGENQANITITSNLERKRMCLWKIGAVWPLPLALHTHY